MHDVANMLKTAVQTVNPKEETKRQAFEDSQRGNGKVFLPDSCKQDIV